MALEERRDRRLRAAILADGDAPRSTPPARASLSSVGSSLTQGAHQVAQRLTSTGMPLKSASVIASPSGSLNLRAGRGLALVAAVDAFDGPASAAAAASLAGCCAALWQAASARSGGTIGMRRMRAPLAEAAASGLVGGDEALAPPVARRLPGLAGCGRVGQLQPAPGHALPVKPAMARDHSDGRAAADPADLCPSRSRRRAGQEVAAARQRPVRPAAGERRRRALAARRERRRRRSRPTPRRPTPGA